MKPFFLAIGLFVALQSPLQAATESPQEPVLKSYSYADIADTLIRAPIVAELTIVRASRLRGDLAVGVPSGHDRYLVAGQVTALLRGEQGLPSRIEYLIDLPASRAIKLRKHRVLIGATMVPGKPNAVRLVSPKAQMDLLPDTGNRARMILAELLAPHAPPQIIGVGSAFHVRGSLPGESETQVFLQTRTQAPISLSITRHPDRSATWVVALGEIVDDAAVAPKRETLLWYRLACSLPADLPVSTLDTLPAADATAIAQDYRVVIDALGPCGRTPG